MKKENAENDGSLLKEINKTIADIDKIIDVTHEINGLTEEICEKSKKIEKRSLNESRR